jgi:hypothetical protein
LVDWEREIKEKKEMQKAGKYKNYGTRKNQKDVLKYEIYCQGESLTVTERGLCL